MGGRGGIGCKRMYQDVKEWMRMREDRSRSQRYYQDEIVGQNGRGISLHGRWIRVTGNGSRWKRVDQDSRGRIRITKLRSG